MRKLICLIGFGLYWAWFCQVCDASPFLVSDPEPTAVGARFQIQEDGKQIVLADNMPDGSIRFDLKDVTVGQHSYQIRYVKTDPLWGTQTSDFTPFQFERPSLAIENIKILKIVP